MKQSLPVLVAGAGPTGMTAAMELSRMGVPVRIIDKAAKFSDSSRALAVQARTLELFQQRGLTAEMLRIGNRALGTSIYGRGKLLASLDLTLIPSPYNCILLIAQSETERLLREHLARQGVAIEKQAELIAVAQSESADAPVTAVLRKSGGSLEEVRAAYLIAAEGAHSSVRHTLGLEFGGKPLPHAYALADVHMEGGLAEDQLSIFLAEEGLLAAFPMGHGRFRIIATEQQPAGDAPDPSLEEMQRLYNGGSAIPARLHDMVWSSRFRINSRMLHRLRVGRIFFGGDSAHVHSPAGGQGMNTGIQDMINLGWKLALVHQGRAAPELLDTYEQERLPVIRGIVSRTEGATDIFDSESRWTQMLLSHAIPLLLGSDTVQRAGASKLSQVEANYRKSPLSEGRGGKAVEAGDRVPPLTVSTPDDAPEAAVSILDLLDPSRFTLLTLRPSPAFLGDNFSAQGVKRLAIAPALGTPADAIQNVFGDADAVLVRPDGYIAWLGREQDRAKLVRWFRRWFAETANPV